MLYLWSVSKWLRVKVIWQRLHLNGLSPVCIRVCRTKSHLLRNLFSQYSHPNGLKENKLIKCYGKRRKKAELNPMTD